MEKMAVWPIPYILLAMVSSYLKAGIVGATLI